MTQLSQSLQERSNRQCELCKAVEALQPYIVPPKTGDQEDEIAVICSTCQSQVNGETEPDSNHWRCLNESMWSEVPAVQVLAWRILKQHHQEDWASDLLNMLYLDEEMQTWAEYSNPELTIIHKDSNGNILAAGDTVVLIQDLKVKGASLTAKRGTAVRRIRLDPDNAEYIEGKVDGQQIVILTKYVKKQ